MKSKGRFNFNNLFIGTAKQPSVATTVCKVSFVCGRSCSPLAYALNYRIPRGYISLWFLKFSRFCIKSRGLCCVHAHIESDLGTSPVDMCVKYLSVLTTHFKMVRAGWVNVNFYKGCITRHMFSLQMSPPPVSVVGHACDRNIGGWWFKPHTM